MPSTNFHINQPLPRMASSPQTSFSCQVHVIHFASFRQRVKTSEWQSIWSKVIWQHWVHAMRKTTRGLQSNRYLVIKSVHMLPSKVRAFADVMFRGPKNLLCSRLSSFRTRYNSHLLHRKWNAQEFYVCHKASWSALQRTHLIFLKQATAMFRHMQFWLSVITNNSVVFSSRLAAADGYKERYSW